MYILTCKYVPVKLYNIFVLTFLHVWNLLYVHNKLLSSLNNITLQSFPGKYKYRNLQVFYNKDVP